MLLKRPSPHNDETLESYLIRVANENGDEHIKPFLTKLKRYLCDIDERRFSSLPTDIAVFNPCHSKQSSASRTHAIRALSHLVFKEPVELQQLTLNRANAKFSPSTTALIRQTESFPRSLLRKGKIPICPRCLNEGGYAKYWWHFEPYTACHTHQSILVTQCLCGHEVDYVNDGLSTHCPQCQNDYIGQTADDNTTELCLWLTGSQSNTFPDVSVSHRWGVMHWWHTQHDHIINIDAFKSYWKNWPNSLYSDIDNKIKHAIEYRVKELSDMTCREVLGEYLFNAMQLPDRNLNHNIILKQVVHYLDEHMLDNNGFIANLRINSIDAALFLNTSLDQVASLVEQTMLKSSIRLKSNSPLSKHADAFYLGDIFCLWLSDFQSANYNRSTYISRW